MAKIRRKSSRFVRSTAMNCSAMVMCAKPPGGGRFCCLPVLLLGLCIQQAQGAAAEHKRLIEFGWDEPDTTFLRTNVARMAQSPFDGCVFHVNYQRGGTNGSFTWEAWGQQAFVDSDLASAFADLKGTRAGRFKYNFLRFNTTPAKLD